MSHTAVDNLKWIICNCAKCDRPLSGISDVAKEANITCHYPSATRFYDRPYCAPCLAVVRRLPPSCYMPPDQLDTPTPPVLTVPVVPAADGPMDSQVA